MRFSRFFFCVLVDFFFAYKFYWWCRSISFYWKYICTYINSLFVCKFLLMMQIILILLEEMHVYIYKYRYFPCVLIFCRLFLFYWKYIYTYINAFLYFAFAFYLISMIPFVGCAMPIKPSSVPLRCFFR